MPSLLPQFCRAWRSLGGGGGASQERRRFLCQLSDPAEDYPRLFKHSLEPQTLSELLRCLGLWEAESVPAAVSHLLGLSRVPRIAAIAMFMGDEERGAVGAVLGKARGHATAGDLDEIRKCFVVQTA